MSRPNRIRNKTVSVRLSPSEYEHLQKKVRESGQTQQSYVINAALGTRISSKGEMEELTNISRSFGDMDRQLRGMGTNLNQMAHVANATGGLPDTYTFERVAAEVEKIKKEVHQGWLSLSALIRCQKHTEE